MIKNGNQIALLGTSADPPTSGHQALLEGLLRLFPKVITWASDNPMKSHTVSLQHRQSLLMALVQEINNPNLEIKQDVSSPWTVETLERAALFWPNQELVFVVGSDLAQQIPTWSQTKAIFEKARLAIVPREGWPVQQDHLEVLQRLGANIDLLPLQIPASSSSSIRSKYQVDQIPAAVLQILLKQNLYGLTPSRSSKLT